jgi:hypothetical protein
VGVGGMCDTDDVRFDVDLASLVFLLTPFAALPRGFVISLIGNFGTNGRGGAGAGAGKPDSLIGLPNAHLKCKTPCKDQHNR